MRHLTRRDAKSQNRTSRRQSTANSEFHPRVITACTDFISRMLRLENEHHATCRRERDDYDLHRGHHVDEGHSARDPTVSEQIRITWSARVSRSHTDPRRATSSAHRSWRRSTTSLRGSRDLLTSIEDQQTPGNTGLIWLSFSPPPCSPSGRAAVLDTDFPGM